MTPTPPRVNPRGEKGTGKKGKGSRTGLSPAREKKTEPGLLLAGLGKGGTAARLARRRRAHPLGSTRAGEGAGDGALPRSTVRSLADSLSSLTRLCSAEKRERRRERERRRKNELGFWRARPRGVLFALSARATVDLHRTAQIHRAGLQPRRVRAPGRIPGPGPGCGLGAGERAGRACGLWAVGRFRPKQ